MFDVENVLNERKVLPRVIEHALDILFAVEQHQKGPLLLAEHRFVFVIFEKLRHSFNNLLVDGVAVPSV